MTAGGGVSGGGTAVLSAPAAPSGTPPLVRPVAGGVPGAPDGRTRENLPLVLRVLAWVVALPLGLAIVGFPARKAGVLSSQDLLDVIVERDLGRFVPLVVVVLLWALVSAVLVTIFVDGGRRLMLRRQRKRGTGDALAGISGPTDSPPPPPRRRG